MESEVTKIFCALTEPELWAQIRDYAKEKGMTIKEYTLDIRNDPTIALRRYGVPATYNATVVYTKNKKGD